MARPIGPFIESPGSYGRRSRLPWIVMLVLMVAVLFVVFRVIPPGEDILSERQARKKIAEAEKLEDQSLNLYAAEIYARIVDSTRINQDLRFKAARGLARASRASGRVEAVEGALEKAVAFSKPGPDRDAVRDELANLRGQPVGEHAPPAPTRASVPNAPAPADSLSNPYPLPSDDNILARIGEETISTEEVLYAWRQFNGLRDPSPEELGPFVRVYLDMVLIADEAQHNGLARQPATVYDLRLRRLMSLNQCLSEKMNREMKMPEIKDLEAYYNQHQELFMTPTRAVIGHIVVKDKDDAAGVRKALAQGQKFGTVAEKYSLDAGRLKSGYILGTITQNDPAVPGFGRNPELAGRLLAMQVNATTGPLTSERGMHWVRIVEKTPGAVRPFQEVQESVLLVYQKARFTQNRQALLGKLRRERPIEIKDPQLRERLASPDGATTATAAAAPTTATLAMPPAPTAEATDTSPSLSGAGPGPSEKTQDR